MPSAAISFSKTLAVIDEDHCIGCTLCIKACPFDAIVGASKSLHSVINSYCTGCKLCIDPCPVDCITMQANHSLENITPIAPEDRESKACIHCGDCIPVCPSDLNPESLYENIRNHKFSLAEKNLLSTCTQCGECNKACPSNLPLMQAFNFGISMIKHKAEKKIFIKESKQRVKLRKLRLANKKKTQQHAFLSSKKLDLADKLQALKNSFLEK